MFGRDRCGISTIGASTATGHTSGPALTTPPATWYTAVSVTNGGTPVVDSNPGTANGEPETTSGLTMATRPAANPPTTETIRAPARHANRPPPHRTERPHRIGPQEEHRPAHAPNPSDNMDGPAAWKRDPCRPEAAAQVPPAQLSARPTRQCARSGPPDTAPDPRPAHPERLVRPVPDAPATVPPAAPSDASAPPRPVTADRAMPYPRSYSRPDLLNPIRAADHAPARQHRGPPTFTTTSSTAVRPQMLTAGERSRRIQAVAGTNVERMAPTIRRQNPDSINTGRSRCENSAACGQLAESDGSRRLPLQLPGPHTRRAPPAHP